MPPDAPGLQGKRVLSEAQCPRSGRGPKPARPVAAMPSIRVHANQSLALESGPVHIGLDPGHEVPEHGKNMTAKARLE